jgi:hypothetical protein
VTASVSFVLSAVPYDAFPAKPKRVFGQTSFTVNVFHREVFTAREFSFIHSDKAFLELRVVVSCSIIHSAYAAVQTARSQELVIYAHNTPPETKFLFVDFI